MRIKLRLCNCNFITLYFANNFKVRLELGMKMKRVGNLGGQSEVATQIEGNMKPFPIFKGVL